MIIEEGIDEMSFQMTVSPTVEVWRPSLHNEDYDDRSVLISVRGFKYHGDKTDSDYHGEIVVMTIHDIDNWTVNEETGSIQFVRGGLDFMVTSEDIFDSLVSLSNTTRPSQVHTIDTFVQKYRKVFDIAYSTYGQEGDRYSVTDQTLKRWYRKTSSVNNGVFIDLDDDITMLQIITFNQKNRRLQSLQK